VKSNTFAAVLGVLGVVFIVAAILYIVGGILPTFNSSPVAGTHTKHAILCAVLAVASFVAANFARVKTV
jgi:accessory gene regulator protein AgrB